MKNKFIISYVCFVILLILTVAVSLKLAQVNELNAELEQQNNELQTKNIIYENTVGELCAENDSLKTNLTNLTKINTNLQTQVEMITLQKRNLFQQIVELKAQLKQDTTVEEPNVDFKTYMSYSAITDHTSKQWLLQQQALTNEDGIRCIDGIPMVAVGTGWGLSVGDTAVVMCENGNYFTVIIGDIKADVHTEADNKTSILTGCRCEFIVEIDKLTDNVRLSGNMATLEKYSGYVTHIREIQ
jgi:hypothetical protein